MSVRVKFRCVYLPLSRCLSLVTLLVEELLQDVHVQLKLLLLLSGQTLHLEPEAQVQLPAPCPLIPELLLLLPLLLQLLHLLLLQLQHMVKLTLVRTHMQLGQKDEE